MVLSEIWGGNKMKKHIKFIVFLLIFCFASFSCFAKDTISDIKALNELNTYIEQVMKDVNKGASEMMKIADMLRCNAIHGKASYTTISIPKTSVGVRVHLVDPHFLFVSLILYVLGFFILMVASFYMFDVAFNVSVTLLILPLGLALWPFGWTRDKLKVMIESIAYYTGIFIFLPLGILIGVKIVTGVAEASFSGAGGDTINLYTAFKDDNTDALSQAFGFWSLGFLKILLCYIVALRVVPLMATEFCSHFFGSSLLGNPIHDKVAQFSQKLKQATIDRAAKHGMNIVRAQTGNMIKNAGNKNGNIIDRTLYQYGKEVAKPKK